MAATTTFHIRDRPQLRRRKRQNHGMIRRGGGRWSQVVTQQLPATLHDRFPIARPMPCSIRTN